MPEKKHSLVRNTLTLYFRMLFSMFVAFFTSRVLLNQLGIVDFGIYNVVGGIVAMWGFLNSTLTLSTQRFLNYELGNDNKENLRKIFSTSIVIHFSFAIIVFLFAETIGLWLFSKYINVPADRMNAAFWVYQCAILSSVLSLSQVPFIASIIAHERMGAYATMGIIDVLLRLAIACALMVVEVDKLKIYSILFFVVSGINFAIYGIYCRRNFEESRFFISKDKSLYKEMLSFSSWNIFSSISIVLNGNVVNFIMNIFFGPVVNAARGITTQVNGAVSGFVNNFQIAVNPQIIKTYAAKEYGSFLSLINKSAKFSFALLLILALPIIIKIDEILLIWLKVVPDYTADFCRIVFVSSLINTFSLPLATAANATGRIKKYQLSVGIFEILNIPVSFILLWLGFPPTSAYFVAAAIIIITLIVRLSILKNLIKLNITSFIREVITPSLLTAFIAFVICFGINMIIETKTLIEVIAFAILAILITSGVIYSIGLNRDEKRYITTAITTRIRKAK